MRSASLLLLLGAAVPQPASGPQYAPSEVPAELRPAVQRAEDAIRSAACDVEREFGEGDPDANAARCEEAKKVAGVKVGRTSARLRNPHNAPPAWAREYVAATDGRKAAAVARVASQRVLARPRLGLRAGRSARLLVGRGGKAGSLVGVRRGAVQAAA